MRPRWPTPVFDDSDVPPASVGDTQILSMTGPSLSPNTSRPPRGRASVPRASHFRMFESSAPSGGSVPATPAGAASATSGPSSTRRDPADLDRGRLETGAKILSPEPIEGVHLFLALHPRLPGRRSSARSAGRRDQVEGLFSPGDPVQLRPAASCRRCRVDRGDDPRWQRKDQ